MAVEEHSVPLMYKPSGSTIGGTAIDCVIWVDVLWPSPSSC